MPPSTIKGKVNISTLADVDNVCVFTISNALFFMVTVGVLEPDLLVTRNDLTITVSFTLGYNISTDSAAVVVLP